MNKYFKESIQMMRESQMFNRLEMAAVQLKYIVWGFMQLKKKHYKIVSCGFAEVFSFSKQVDIEINGK